MPTACTHPRRNSRTVRIALWHGLGMILCSLHLQISTAAEPEPADSQSFRAGAATSNITPPLGGAIIGGFTPIPATHIHDELHVRCLVLDDGQHKVAIVVCDLLGIHRSVSDVARARIQERTGIPSTHVLISATHTHSATTALGQSRYDQTVPLDTYQEFVVQRIVDGVQRAATLLRPAELIVGQVDVPEHVFNRRWHMTPGSIPPNPFGQTDLVKMNPPAGSRDLLEPAGPIDPTISFLYFREPTGAPIALYAAYSLHYVGGVGNGHVSADYFGMFCDALQRRLQPPEQELPFVAMLANGTSGNINNINFRTPRPAQPAYQQMRHVARDVAEKVDSATQGLTGTTAVSLQAVWKELDVGWRIPTAAQLDWANQTLAQPEPAPGKTDLARIYAERVRNLADQPAIAPVPLQVLRIGPVCIGTMPCEVFCEIGLAFRQRSAQQPAFLVSLSHGYFGYLPTPEQHRLGGYETWLGTSRLEEQASDKMLDELIRMTETVRRP